MAACTNCGKGLGMMERAKRQSLCNDCTRIEEQQALAAKVEQRRLDEQAEAERQAERAAAEAQARAEASPTYGVDLDPATVADAKLSIKELRLRKRELQAEKRDVSSTMADARAQWRERQAGRVSTAGMGRGTFGQVVRASVQANRRSERMGHAKRVNAIQDQKQGIDDLILEIDRAIAGIERFVARSS